MNLTKLILISIVVMLTAYSSVYAKYTETMDPEGLSKNMKDDYALVDDNAATNQSEKLRSAISDVNASRKIQRLLGRW